MPSSYEYRLTVSYGETNALGNVYFVNHLAWQGKVREMFLLDHAPGLLDRIGRDFTLVTKSVHCEYEQELRAFDRIVIRMQLARLGENNLQIFFDYFRINDSGQEERMARGAQELACLDVSGQLPRAFPAELVAALKPFSVHSGYA